MTDQKQPNIIFLMSDQQRWDALGVVNPLIKTPCMDQICKDGIRFDQTVCQSPMCVPSRLSMMCGLYPWQTGVRNNGQHTTNDDQLANTPLPELLRQQGYYTLGFGKTHWYGDRFENRPTDRGFTKLWHGRPHNLNLMPEKCITWEEDEPEAFAAWKEEQRILPKGGESFEGYMGQRSEIPGTHHREGWLTRKCLEELDQLSQSDSPESDQPLFLYFSMDFPHAGLYVPAEFEDMYNIEDIEERPLAPWYKMRESHRPNAHIENFHERWAALEPEQRRMCTLRYYAATSYIDDCYQQVMDKLEALGYLENSLIVYVSDHGEMLGDRDHRFSKYCLYDPSVRMPLMVAGSCVPEDKRGTVDQRPAELVDLYPTLAHIAGYEDVSLDALPGRSLFEAPYRLGAFSEMNGAGGRFEPSQRGPALMWRTKEWKLIIHQHHICLDKAPLMPEAITGELYNLIEDPLEATNLYTVDEHRDVREKMTLQLLMHIAQANARWPRYGSVQGIAYNPPEEIGEVSAEHGVKYWY